MLRKRFKSLPEWDEVVSKWTWDQAYKNAWRTRPLCDADDLYSEGYLTWCRVMEKYPRVLDQRHAMGLYKVSFLNQIHDLAKRRPRHPLPFTELGDYELVGLIQDPRVPRALQEVDREIDREGWSEKAKMLLEAFQGLQIPSRRSGEGVNAFLCRAVGFDPGKVDLAALLDELALTPGIV